MSHQGACQGSCVFITGCSSGIGAACRRDLMERGWRVFAGVRKEADVERLRSESAGRLQPLIIDVADEGTVQAAAQALAEAVGTAGLAGLVNNAGIAVPGPWELLTTDDLRRQLEVNVVGTHAVTRAVLPLLRRAGGRIVLMGSISGRVAPPFYGAYAASKHALEAMADTLRMELRPWRISVSIVEPDAVGTPIWEKFDVQTESLARRGEAATGLYEEQIVRLRRATRRMGRAGMPASAVVCAVRHALTARRPRRATPWAFVRGWRCGQPRVCRPRSWTGFCCALWG